ncbi:MAG TPA: hypothetical protein VNW97_06995 [Candidatus Saccharimonadales bacterium]|jgi:hypothetical protein|nr:hypothetical protein [Candidatus Saccharimonadales bacterium]
MKQRYSVSLITPLCILTFILVLGCTGCGKPPMFHIVARDERADESERYKIFLQGRELGTVTGKGTFEFDAEGRKGDTLQQMQPEIEVRIPWVCGWVKTDFSMYLARPDEIKRARADHRAIQAIMQLFYIPPSFEWVTIFVDNRGGPPQTVSIGEKQEQVPVGATQSVRLPSGSCDKAKDVRLNGEIVALVNTRQTLLIDIAHSHCYRVEWSGYGFDDSGHGKTIYQPHPFQLLNSNPDFFMEPLPGSVVTTGAGTVRDTLKDVACPKHNR